MKIFQITFCRPTCFLPSLIENIVQYFKISDISFTTPRSIYKLLKSLKI